MSWRDELRAIVNEVSANEVPDLIGELARAGAVATQRLQRPPGHSENGRPARTDRNISAEQVAEWLGVSPKFVYAHAKELGALRLSNRCVRFSQAAVRRFITARRQ